MSASPILGITQVATNQTAKESTINTGFAQLEAASNAALTKSLVGGDLTLSPQDWTRNAIFLFTAATADQVVTVPATPRLVVFSNRGGHNIIVKAAGAATGSGYLTLASGKAMFAFSDGVNIVGLTSQA